MDRAKFVVSVFGVLLLAGSIIFAAGRITGSVDDNTEEIAETRQQLKSFEMGVAQDVKDLRAAIQKNHDAIGDLRVELERVRQ